MYLFGVFVFICSIYISLETKIIKNIYDYLLLLQICISEMYRYIKFSLKEKNSLTNKKNPQNYAKLLFTKY